MACPASPVRQALRAEIWFRHALLTSPFVEARSLPLLMHSASRTVNSQGPAADVMRLPGRLHRDAAPCSKRTLHRPDRNGAEAVQAGNAPHREVAPLARYVARCGPWQSVDNIPVRPAVVLW
ncbi:MAG: hypothetical protein Gyms2KO_22220 [Gymnodinialimonas sp.]